jgi:hypothetical protein
MAEPPGTRASEIAVAPDEDRGPLRLDQDSRRHGADHVCGIKHVRARFTLAMVACNLPRLPKPLGT